MDITLRRPEGHAELVRLIRAMANAKQRDRYPAIQFAGVDADGARMVMDASARSGQPRVGG